MTRNEYNFSTDNEIVSLGDNRNELLFLCVVSLGPSLRAQPGKRGFLKMTNFDRRGKSVP